MTRYYLRTVIVIIVGSFFIVLYGCGSTSNTSNTEGEGLRRACHNYGLAQGLTTGAADEVAHLLIGAAAIDLDNGYSKADEIAIVATTCADTCLSDTCYVACLDCGYGVIDYVYD